MAINYTAVAGDISPKSYYFTSLYLQTFSESGVRNHCSFCTEALIMILVVRGTNRLQYVKLSLKIRIIG